MQHDRFFPQDFAGKRQKINEVHALITSSTLSALVAAVGSWGAYVKGLFDSLYPAFAEADQAFELSDSTANKEALDLQIAAIEKHTRYFVDEVVKMARRYPGAPSVALALAVLHLTVTADPITEGFASHDAFEYKLEMTVDQLVFTILVLTGVLNGSDKVLRFFRIIFRNPETGEIVGEIHIENGKRRNFVHASGFLGCLAEVHGTYVSSKGEHGEVETVHTIRIPGTFDPNAHRSSDDDNAGAQK